MRTVPVRELPQCDFCAEYGVKRRAQYDGPTRHGPHAHMCPYHYEAEGILKSSITVRFVREKQTPLPGVDA
jgi:hypothetical protein